MSSIIEIISLGTIKAEICGQCLLTRNPKNTRLNFFLNGKERFIEGTTTTGAKFQEKPSRQGCKTPLV